MWILFPVTDYSRSETWSHLALQVNEQIHADSRSFPSGGITGRTAGLQDHLCQLCIKLCSSHKRAISLATRLFSEVLSFQKSYPVKLKYSESSEKQITVQTSTRSSPVPGSAMVSICTFLKEWSRYFPPLPRWELPSTSPEDASEGQLASVFSNQTFYAFFKIPDLLVSHCCWMKDSSRLVFLYKHTCVSRFEKILSG